MRIGGGFASGMKFSNQHIKRTPPPRDYFYLEFGGNQRGHPFSVRLNKVSMEELRRTINTEK